MANYNGHEGDIKVAEEAGLGLNMFVLMVGDTKKTTRQKNTTTNTVTIVMSGQFCTVG